MLRGWGLKFSQSFSSLALTACDLLYYKDMEEKAHSLTELNNEEAVYGTAPATPGLLISNFCKIVLNATLVTTRQGNKL